MSGERFKDCAWGMDEHPTMEGAMLAVLMDLRDELKEANRHLQALKEDGLRLRFPLVKSLDAVRRMDKRLAQHMPLKAKPGRKR